MLIFAARLFWVGSMFVSLAFSQTQTMPPTQAAPSPSPSPAITRHATKQANIWQERVDEAIHPKKFFGRGRHRDFVRYSGRRFSTVSGGTQKRRPETLVSTHTGISHASGDEIG